MQETGLITFTKKVWIPNVYSEEHTQFNQDHTVIGISIEAVHFRVIVSSLPCQCYRSLGNWSFELQIYWGPTYSY